MAKAAEPAVSTNEIVFELERFERSDGQLMLTGRWFGVRGRRFVRPTLTLALEGERARALADLDDKPWAAEDGEPWKASFPWGRAGRVEQPELSVASDITIQLPVPGGRRVRPQRLAAQPRREVMTASWERFEAVEAEAAPPAPPAPELAGLLAELDELREQLGRAENATAASTAEAESLRAELSSLRAELDALRARHDAAQRELRGRGDEIEAARAELTTTRAAREAALRNAAQAEAERDGALTRVAETEAERDALLAQNAELAAALEGSRSAVEQLTREQHKVVAARGAALVMRGATQALPAHEQHVGWVRRSLAVLVLIGIVFAVLIVLGAL
jgi:hypothetical protein